MIESTCKTLTCEETGDLHRALTIAMQFLVSDPKEIGTVNRLGKIRDNIDMDTIIDIINESEVKEK